jgi:predicted dehydrogenase
MNRRSLFVLSLLTLTLVAAAGCGRPVGGGANAMNESNNSPAGQVKLITLDPGHFHAALVQKTMLPNVSPVVHVYAPAGLDLDLHLKRIEGYNTRADGPTTWETKVYTGADYLEKMIVEKAGNVVVLAGNNRKKTEYIKASVDAGLNVLSDKPMCIDEKGYELLKAAFASAEKNGVLLYDIMTERYEITTMLQKELAHSRDVFGELQKGTPANPAVTKESVHHFSKTVSGKPLQRPAWYFDTAQQGEGIVDVTTHLVDLVFWESFPEQKVTTGDVELVSARRWSTPITREQFAKVTSQAEFPDFLKGAVDQKGVLNVFSNGEMTFKVKGVHAKTSVIWNYEAPAGAGDTHFSVMRGTKANVVIRQGKEENYKPELYVEAAPGAKKADFEATLRKAVAGLQAKYPGIEVKAAGERWQIVIPEKYRDGHEAHFGMVASKYLGFLKDKKMPDWEVPNILAKYYVTTQALKLARQGEGGRPASKAD